MEKYSSSVCKMFIYLLNGCPRLESGEVEDTEVALEFKLDKLLDLMKLSKKTLLCLTAQPSSLDIEADISDCVFSNLGLVRNISEVEN